MAKRAVIANSFIKDGDDFIVARGVAHCIPTTTQDFDRLAAFNPAMRPLLKEMCEKYAPEELSAFANALRCTVKGHSPGHWQYPVPPEAEQRAREIAVKLARIKASRRSQEWRDEFGKGKAEVAALLPMTSSEGARADRAAELLKRVLADQRGRPER